MCELFVFKVRINEIFGALKLMIFETLHKTNGNKNKHLFYNLIRVVIINVSIIYFL